MSAEGAASQPEAAYGCALASLRGALMSLRYEREPTAADGRAKTNRIGDVGSAVGEERGADEGLSRQRRSGIGQAPRLCPRAGTLLVMMLGGALPVPLYVLYEKQMGASGQQDG